eukprot:g79861.t1
MLLFCLVVAILLALSIALCWCYVGGWAALSVFLLFYALWWFAYRDGSEWRTGKIDMNILQSNWLDPNPVEFLFQDEWNKAPQHKALRQAVFAVSPHGPMSQYSLVPKLLSMVKASSMVLRNTDLSWCHQGHY